MRLNTRNLILIGAGLLVVVALIVIGNQGDDAPADPTETAAENGRFFPDLATENVTRLEVRSFEVAPDDDAPTPTPTVPPLPDTEPPPAQFGEVVIEKDAQDFWTINEATNAVDRGTDQATVVGVVGLLAELGYVDRFGLDTVESDLAAFGLDEPRFEIVLATEEDEFRLLLGEKNPGGRRYYAQLDGEPETIYLAPVDILDNVVAYVTEPPYVPAPTATPTPFPTANPFSEVEQTATAQAAFEATATAVAEIAPTEGVGPDAPETDDNEDESDN